MKTLDFSAQRSPSQALRQDTTLINTWETETFLAIPDHAKKEGVTVYLETNRASVLIATRPLPGHPKVKHLHCKISADDSRST
jgi:hypothetical protein